MSLWSDLSEHVNAEVVATFGIPATLQRQDGSTPEEILGVIQRPGLSEDFTPGGSQGVSAVRLFVNFADIQPPPQHGDTVTLNGITYVVTEVEADTNGAAVLKLRIT
jgi:hypothetical protein